MTDETLKPCPRPDCKGQGLFSGPMGHMTRDVQCSECSIEMRATEWQTFPRPEPEARELTRETYSDGTDKKLCDEFHENPYVEPDRPTQACDRCHGEPTFDMCPSCGMEKCFSCGSIVDGALINYSKPAQGTAMTEGAKEVIRLRESTAQEPGLFEKSLGERSEPGSTAPPDDEARRLLNEICDLFRIGTAVRDRRTILSNVENTIRRSRCLSRIEQLPQFSETIECEETGEIEQASLLSWGESPDEYERRAIAILNKKDTEARRLLMQAEPLLHVLAERSTGYHQREAKKMVGAIDAYLAQTDEKRELTHEPSGMGCLAGHEDGEGQCIKCLHCNEFIRPSQMNQVCLARYGQTDAEGE